MKEGLQLLVKMLVYYFYSFTKDLAYQLVIAVRVAAATILPKIYLSKYFSINRSMNREGVGNPTATTIPLERGVMVPD